MEFSGVQARVNKSGTHVICGMVDCSSRIATVGKQTTEEVAEAQVPGELNVPIIQFLAGWAQRQDKVWFFTDFARTRKFHDKSIRNRRYPWEHGYAGENDIFDILPARAKCASPGCGMMNVLNVANIGVSRILRLPAKPDKSSAKPRWVL